MFENFDHKFKGKKGYNFFIIFVGLQFASFLILPDDWRSTTAFIFTAFVSLLVAHFASKNIDHQKNNEH